MRKFIQRRNGFDEHPARLYNGLSLHYHHVDMILDMKKEMKEDKRGMREGRGLEYLWAGSN